MKDAQLQRKGVFGFEEGNFRREELGMWGRVSDLKVVKDVVRASGWQ